MKPPRWMIGKWGWNRIPRLLGLIYLSLTIMTCSLSNKIIFLPPPPQYAEYGADLEILDPGEQQVACFYLPPKENQFVLLWAHGNAEDIGSLKPLFEAFQMQGLGVLGYDYPGYGHSAGSPGERSCYRNAERAYQFLVEEQKIDPARLILLGQSVGTGPTCWLAERHQVHGVVLIAPFLSVYRTLTHFPIIPGDKFKNLKRIRKIEAPLLVIHGTSDRAIPFRQGQRIYHEHRGPKTFLEIKGAGHNNIWNKGWTEMFEAIKTLAKIPRSQPPSAP
ncbi:MAG: alpha/beta fold hydrolase [Roseibacillus sp.]|nr:alpha/beta fold hydrolase [Roseibacillus sp.]